MPSGGRDPETGAPLKKRRMSSSDLTRQESNFSTATDETYDDGDGDFEFEDEDEGGDDIEFDEQPKEEGGESGGIEILDADSLLDQLNEGVVSTMELLNLSASAACKVLRHYEFNATKLRDEYFEDENLLDKLGLELGNKDESPIRKETGDISSFECPICFCSPEEGEELWTIVQCGHQLCGACWVDLLMAEVSKGVTCVEAKCPIAIKTDRLAMHGCQSHLGEPVFKNFLVGADEAGGHPYDGHTQEGRAKAFKQYKLFLLRSFVEVNGEIRWCPAPDCKYAVRRSRGVETTEIVCKCGEKFCFACGNEAHAPSSCKQLSDWKVREQGESDNLKWITANTRPCPGCQRPTEKIEGCNHMQFCPCKHHWCWECNGPWDNTHSGRYYNCPLAGTDQVKEKTWQRNKAQTELTQYVEYYNKSTEHGRIFTINRVKDRQRGKEYIDKLAEYNPGIDTRFIDESVDQLLFSRSYLKYCYVYGYALLCAKEESKHKLFMDQVHRLEMVVNDLNTMLEQNYRFEFTHGAAEPPVSRDTIRKTTAECSRLLSICKEGG